MMPCRWGEIRWLEDGVSHLRENEPISCSTGGVHPISGTAFAWKWHRDLWRTPPYGPHYVYWTSIRLFFFVLRLQCVLLLFVSALTACRKRDTVSTILRTISSIQTHMHLLLMVCIWFCWQRMPFSFFLSTLSEWPFTLMNLFTYRDWCPIFSIFFLHHGEHWTRANPGQVR